jgi:hypothetical protein
MSNKRTKSKTSRSAIEGDVGAADLEILKSFADQVLQDTSQPDIVRNLAESLQKVIAHSKNAEAKSAGTIDALKRSLSLSMGITPSSERGAGVAENDPASLAPDDDEEALVLKKLNKARQVRRFASIAETKLRLQLDKLQASRLSRDAATSCTTSETDVGPASGSGENETVFSPGVKLYTDVNSNLGLPVEQVRTDGCIMGDVTRNRTDLVLVQTRVEMRGKTVFDPLTGERFDYDFSLVGPPGSCFTWRACLFVVLHVIGQAAPLARVERMLNGKPFTRQNMHRVIGYVAKIGLPVYLRLAEELAQADVLSGDDTHSRVVEVAKALRSGKEPWAAPEDSGATGSSNLKAADDDSDSSSSDSMEQTEPESGRVFRSTVEDLGYRFPKVKHPGRFKEQHVTTCLHGQVAGKPRIVFYRSHLGSLGNLLERILLMRNAKRSQVILVADLSSANRVRDPELLAKVSLAYAGCSAHARRPFYRYASHRLEDCLEILDYFKMIAIIEDRIKDDPPDTRLWLRSEYEHSEQYYWTLIKTKCEELSQIFSDQTPLGKASRYVLRNYDALTMYLRTSNLPADNNRSERLLRIERLTERNTYGSKTIEGRTRLDILRTLLTTCRYADLDEAIYLLKLMITPPSLIEKKPENYTPSAIKALLADNPTERKQLENILHADDLASLVKPSSNYQRKANQPS